MTGTPTGDDPASGPGPARGSLPVVRTTAELRERVRAWRQEGKTVGLVPTMGALHVGHMALVEAAKAACDRIIVTLFVNPKQFNQSNDLANYPRDEAGDRAKLEKIGTDLLFAPGLETMYPADFRTQVTVADLGDCLCGAARPGHMEGVSTVVAKLLLQSLPDQAFFGEKDYQQLLIISQMVADLEIPVTISPVATVREADGLACSSRNFNLTPAQRQAAPALYRVLTDCRDRLFRGDAVAPLLQDAQAELITAGFDRVDYLELRHAKTLALLDQATPDGRLFAAAWLGPTRLIDNISVA